MLSASSTAERLHELSIGPSLFGDTFGAESSESTTFLVTELPGTLAVCFDTDEDGDVDECCPYFEKPLLDFTYVPLALCAALERADLWVTPLVFDCLGDDVLEQGTENLTAAGISTFCISFSLLPSLYSVFAASLHAVALYCSSDIVFDTSSSKLKTAAN